MDIRFDGKTALITGASTGIGAAIAHELAASGATVCLAARTASKLTPVVEDIAAAGGKAYAMPCDVSDPGAVEALVARTVETTGGLHLLVNNAGISGPAADAGAYPLDGWREVIDTNLNGVFYGLRFGLPAIEASGGGAVVNMSSILGSVGMATSPAYVAAKHALLGLTKSAALAYAQRGIRINAVGPAFVRTPMIDDGLDAETQARITALHPVGRMGRSDEISGLAAFLLSDRASFVTGSYHLADGGFTAQ
ncbi:SDR family oxidoreductase [Rhodovulum sulfidophilum]|nr:SDR family oxidoreductase [Rhodovulum sulfidophilum]